MRAKKILSLLAWLAMLTAGATPAAGQSRKAERQARTHYAAGAKHFRAGRYPEALAEYRAAYELVPKPALLFNMARALEENGDKAEALEHYRRYLTEAPDGAVAGEAREFAAALERELAPPPAPAEPPAGPGPTPTAAPPGPPAEPATEAPVQAPAPAVPAPAPAAPPTDSAAVTTPAAATSDRPRALSAGVMVGVAIADITLEDWEGGARVGIAAGAFGRYAPLPYLGARVEALFVQKGAGRDEHNYGSNWDTNFLQASLLAEVRVWRLSLVLGPFAGVRVSADTPINDELHDGELGLVAGGGVAFPLGPGALTLDLRHDRGLTSMKPEVDVFNRTFEILLGYALR